jgi:hypothetical protein
VLHTSKEIVYILSMSLVIEAEFKGNGLIDLRRKVQGSPPFRLYMVIIVCF